MYLNHGIRLHRLYFGTALDIKQDQIIIIIIITTIKSKVKLLIAFIIAKEKANFKLLFTTSHYKQECFIRYYFNPKLKFKKFTKIY